MNFKKIIFLMIVALFPLAASARTAPAHRADEAALRKLVRTFTSAWNRHDPGAMAQVWSHEGDVINPAGRVAEGRSAVQNLLAEEHAGMFARSNMRITVESIDFVSPDVAVIDTKNVLTLPKG